MPVIDICAPHENKGLCAVALMNQAAHSRSLSSLRSCNCPVAWRSHVNVGISWARCRLVLVGQSFGGLVAHTLAARLLLQVQHEIHLAQKMGINLSALSQTKDKVGCGAGRLTCKRGEHGLGVHGRHTK